MIENIYVNNMWTTWYLMCMTKQKDVPVIRTNNLNPDRKVPLYIIKIIKQQQRVYYVYCVSFVYSVIHYNK